MAFFSMFLIAALFIMGFIGVCTAVGAIFLLVYRKSGRKGHKVLGIIFMAPLTLSVCLVIAGAIYGVVTYETRLAFSVCGFNYSHAERLLKLGVDPDCTTSGNKHAQDGRATLLHIVISGREYSDPNFMDMFFDDDVSHEERLEMAKLLIDHGADVNYRTYTHEENFADHKREGDDHAIFHSTDECGYTPLLQAVQSGDLDMVKLLVESGADVNACDYCGYNAVNVLAEHLDDERGLDMLDYLLENGADASHVTNLGQTCVWLAERNRASQTPLDNEKILRRLMDEAGYHLEMDRDYWEKYGFQPFDDSFYE